MQTLPVDLASMISDGIVDRFRDPSDDLSIYDLRFLPAAEIKTCRVVDGQLFLITPFAKNGAGDFWGFVSSELPDGSVTLFYHDDPEVERVAHSVAELIFRQTVRFAGQRKLEGADNFRVPDAQRRVQRIASVMSPYFDEKEIVTLREICSATPVNEGDYGLTLISDVQVNRLMESTALNVYHETDVEWFE